MELLSSHASFSLFDERCPLSNTRKKKGLRLFFSAFPAASLLRKRPQRWIERASNTPCFEKEKQGVQAPERQSGKSILCRRSIIDLSTSTSTRKKREKSKMVVWHSFLPFGLSIAICVFVSWKSVENQLELREAGRTGGDSEVRRRCGEEGEEERGGGDEVDEATSTTQLGPYRHRPPRTASELRARLQTLAKMPPGPRRLARGKALALAAEHALREASPEAEGGGNGNAENDDGEEIVFVESNAAAALRQTLPWLDARLAALASEDVRAIGCGLCGICAGHEDACATHAWPCGVAGGGTEGGGGRGGGGRVRRGPTGCGESDGDDAPQRRGREPCRRGLERRGPRGRLGQQVPRHEGRSRTPSRSSGEGRDERGGARDEREAGDRRSSGSGRARSRRGRRGEDGDAFP